MQTNSNNYNKAAMDTMTRQKLRKKKLIMESAIELFCDYGIEATKIEDVAAKANVGTATIYRYFSTKVKLAIQSAALFWEKEADHYLAIFRDRTYELLTGIEQVERILFLFGELYENNPKFLKFLQEFDFFVKNNAILPESLKEYEKTILNLQPYVTMALEKGIDDQTIELNYSVEQTYFAITHTMLSLLQKLALRGDILDSNARVTSQMQINIIVELIVRGLKRREMNEKANV